MDFERKIGELFLELPDPPVVAGSVVSSVLEGKLLYVGGVLPAVSGKISYPGRLGVEVTLDKGKIAARHALLVGLSVIRSAIGSFNKVRQIVQMTGFVASGPDFTEQDRVLDAPSQLLHDIFGKAGHHTRIAVGVQRLPKGAPVALSLIVGVK